jgi:hypothetical protein
VSARVVSPEADVPLTVGGIFRAALDLYRRYPLRVAGLALLVFLPVELLQEFVAEHTATPSADVGEALVKVTPQLVAAALTLLAEITYAGLIDLTAEARLEHRPTPTVEAALRHLPYVRLLAVAILAGLLALLGLVLLIVPGLVVAVLTCIAGTVAIRDPRPPHAIIARSARLVRPHWRLAAVVFLVPPSLASIVEDGVHALVHDHLLSLVLASAALHVTFYAVGGVGLAMLGERLVGEDARARA